MNQFALFAGDRYYPGGGWDDFVGSYETIDEALIALLESHKDWGHVVDLITGEIVKAWYDK